MSDLEIELINYDEEVLRSGVALSTQQMRVDEDRGADPRHPAARAERCVLDYHPGQYVDIRIPDSDEVRSFSMANLPGNGELEFMIKVYEDG